MAYFLSVCLWLFGVVFPQTAFFQRAEAASPKPLVLQWEVSHPRNTDQVSLIFRQSTVELVTNTSHWQKGQKPRLGRFGSSMTSELNRLKRQVKQAHVHLKQTVSARSLIKDPRFQSPPSPHTPVLRINGEEIKEGHPYFEPLSRIIRQAWQMKWICLECATYQRRGGAISRTSQIGPDSGIKTKGVSAGGIKTEVFSKKKLNCVSKGGGKMECVDPQFGIFEI